MDDVEVTQTVSFGDLELLVTYTIDHHNRMIAFKSIHTGGDLGAMFAACSLGTGTENTNVSLIEMLAREVQSCHTMN